MNKNDKKDIFSRSIIELRKNLHDAKKDMFQLIVDNSQFKLKDNRQIFHKKKEIARILTAIREKELVVASEVKSK